MSGDVVYKEKARLLTSLSSRIGYAYAEKIAEIAERAANEAIEAAYSDALTVYTPEEITQQILLDFARPYIEKFKRSVDIAAEIARDIPTD